MLRKYSQYPFKKLRLPQGPRIKSDKKNELVDVKNSTNKQKRLSFKQETAALSKKKIKILILITSPITLVSTNIFTRRRNFRRTIF